ALATQSNEVAREVEVSENVDGAQRVVHLHFFARSHALQTALSSTVSGTTGITTSAGPPAGLSVVSGSAYVADTFDLGDEVTFSIRRHVLALFQGNRFLLRDLLSHVLDQVAHGSRVIDLYAGGGLFSIGAARARGADVIAVEGDAVAAEDLRTNADRLGN